MGKKASSGNESHNFENCFKRGYGYGEMEHLGNNYTTKEAYKIISNDACHACPCSKFWSFVWDL